MAHDFKELWRRLSEFSAGIMEENEVPGIAVGVYHEGKQQSGGLGITNLNHPLPVTDETLFQIGSITKTFTGTAIMRLVEIEQVDLDTPVQHYLPDFKVVDEVASCQATVLHLLIHTGGWVGDLFDDTGPCDDALANYVANMANLEQLAPLGKLFSYNNAGFAVAGRIIEVVTERSYEEMLNDLVLEPLSLKNCYLEPGEVMTYRFAVGHSEGEEGLEVAEPWSLPRSIYSVGGIVSNVKDLMKYALFHLGDGTSGDGTRLLMADSLAQMQSPQLTVWGKEARGLSWAIDDTFGVRQVMHGGGTKGQVSMLMLVPEQDFAVVILTNSERGDFVTRAVSNWALTHYLSLEVTEPLPIVSSKEKLADYAGYYSRPFADIELGILGSRLVGQQIPKGGFPTKDMPPPPMPPPMSLALIEEDRLLVMDGPNKGYRLDIIRKSDGSIGWLRDGSRLHMRKELD